MTRILVATDGSDSADRAIGDAARPAKSDGAEERVAVATDFEWVRLAVNAFRFIVPGDVRVFGTVEAADARHWIAGD